MSKQIVLSKEMLEGLSKSALLEIMLSTQAAQPSSSPAQAKIKRSRPDGPLTFVTWTNEEDAELVANFALGFSISDLSELHNRSYHSINGRLHRLGVKQKSTNIRIVKAKRKKTKRESWTPEQDAALLSDLAKGYTVSAHAKRCGRTYGSVGNRLDRLQKAGKTQLGLNA